LTRGWLSSLWLHLLDPLRVLARTGAKIAASVVVVFLFVEFEDAGFDLFELSLRVRCHHRESLDLILETLNGFFILVIFFDATHSGLRRCGDVDGVNGGDGDSGECTRDFVKEIISCSLGLNRISRLQRSGSRHHLKCALMHRDVAGADNSSAVLHSDFEGLWVAGDEVVALVFEEGVATSASHAGAVGIAAVPARFTLSSVLTLRRGLGLREGVDRGGERLDLRH
jgi:hypothetical protein